MNPPLKIPDRDMRLDGFRWHPDLRPDRQSMKIDEILPPGASPGMFDRRLPPVPEKTLEDLPESAPETAPQNRPEIEPDNSQQKAPAKVSPIKAEVPEDIRDLISPGT